MAITKEQALNASMFHAEDVPGRECSDRRGPIRWRRNGKTKTWKRQPQRFQVPVKFGIYSHGYITDTNSTYFHVEEACPVYGVALIVEPVPELVPASPIGQPDA